jgi:hypothetical protein
MKQRVATVLIAVGAWFAAWGMRILARAVVAEPVAPAPVDEPVARGGGLLPEVVAINAWLETHDIEEEPDWPRQEAIKPLSNPHSPCSCQRCTVRRAQQKRAWN